MFAPSYSFEAIKMLKSSIFPPNMIFKNILKGSKVLPFRGTQALPFAFTLVSTISQLYILQPSGNAYSKVLQERCWAITQLLDRTRTYEEEIAILNSIEWPEENKSST